MLKHPECFELELVHKPICEKNCAKSYSSCVHTCETKRVWADRRLSSQSRQRLVLNTYVLVDLQYHRGWVEVHAEVIHQNMQLPDLFCHGIRYLNVSRGLS